LTRWAGRKDRLPLGKSRLFYFEHVGPVPARERKEAGSYNSRHQPPHNLSCRTGRTQKCFRAPRPPSQTVSVTDGPVFGFGCSPKKIRTKTAITRTIPPMMIMTCFFENFTDIVLDNDGPRQAIALHQAHDVDALRGAAGRTHRSSFVRIIWPFAESAKSSLSSVTTCAETSIPVFWVISAVLIPEPPRLCVLFL